ncbi:beta-glucosidase [Sphingomonas sp. RP10(2022)]|uniref:Beta-glucosidase n=1 Tax=Sphingomonas liriopis TaxID=2949094 RepID=A0A9X2KUE7_9SPHN|nr:glycoside hydrolase family 3 protein [Sphingomonas liriopis]MCP3735913.1 beta-glucosidase [Sphingomonas liriopis]
MTTGRRIAALALLASSSIATAQQASRAASPDARAEATLKQMTPAEKISLIHGPMPSFLPAAKRPVGVPIGAGVIMGVPRLGIPNLTETDASLGVSNLNDLRKGDVATALPSGMALAATWDPEVARAGGAMIGSEARAKGFNVMLVGGVNLVRDPRAGRNFEYLGEDLLLAGTMVGAQIAGVQSNHIIGTIKHFAANAIETGRNVHTVDMDEAEMRESDLLAFQIGIETGDPHSVMCGYNRVNGAYACENAFLLNDVLRRDWGFKGFVMSDWGAVHSSEAILKGLDQQSGEQIDGKRWFSDLMVAAVADGRVPQGAVDTSVRRILRTMYASGVVDRPVTGGAAIDYGANGAVALRAAEDGIVLLRNEGGILPLAATARSIVVIGGHADIGVLSGGGSSQVRPVGGFALEERQKGAGTASFAKRSYGGTAPLAALKAVRPDAQISFVDGSDAAAAAAAAKAADVAIVFAEKWSTEAADQKDLSLDGNADALIAAVAAANPRTVVVLETGNPVAMPWRDRVPAILAAWFPGQRGGDAIARVLTGAVNPSGHLPVTFPASVAQLPNPVLPGSNVAPADAATRATYGLMAGTKSFAVTFPEGADAGYRWYAAKGLTPLYPFGHGLSYTSFRYDRLAASGGKALTVRFSVTNTGQRAGADVPQVYVTRPGRAKRLIGWGKPMLAPGETREVSVVADPRVIGDYDVKAQRWVVPAGIYGIEVGPSATETSLRARVKLAKQTLKP